MTRKQRPGESLPRLHPAPWIGAYVLLACALDFSQFHRGHHSDSILPSLTSTMHWTTFYWRNDRYGMVFPLLAMPIHNPLGNLLFIAFLTIGFSIAAHFLLARLLFAPHRWWPVVGSAALMFTMLVSTRHYIFEFYGTSQFQGPPLALGCAGLWVADAGRQVWRYPLALGLMMLMAWYNVSTPIILIVIVGCKLLCSGDLLAYVQERRWKEAVMYKNGAFPLLAASFVGGWLLMKNSRYASLDLSAMTPLAELPAAWKGFWHDSVRGFTYGMKSPWFPYALIAVWLAVVGVLVVQPKLRPAAAQALRNAGAGQLAAAVFVVLVSTQLWVRNNGYDYRYVIPAYFITLVAATGAGTALWFAKNSAGSVARVALACWVVTMMACVYRYGVPSLQHVREDLARRSTMTNDILRYNVTHVAGDYWNVWMQVFNANWALYEQGSSNQVFGMANRAEDTMALWPKDHRAWRIAIENVDRNRVDLRRFNVGQAALVAETHNGLVVKPVD